MSGNNRRNTKSRRNGGTVALSAVTSGPAAGSDPGRPSNAGLSVESPSGTAESRLSARQKMSCAQTSQVGHCFRAKWRQNDVNENTAKNGDQRGPRYSNRARHGDFGVVQIGCRATGAEDWPPQLAARFQPAPLWLEERIREALAEPAEPVTARQFDRTMKAIADGR